MKVYGGVLAGALLLTGCGEADEPAAPPSQAAADAPPEVPVMGAERRILALGDSLFAGYGLERGQGYPEMLEAALRARGIDARIANAGLSGDTTAGGLQRLKFTLDSQKVSPELVLISLGGNDILRGLPPAQTRENLEAILKELQRRGIKAMLMGMLAPPNLGADYRRRFDTMYPELAKKHDAVLVPFFMQAVMDRPDLVQQDRLHPTERGIEAIVAATIDKVASALPRPDAPPPPR